MHVSTCKQVVVARHINMNQDARSAVLAKKGYLTILQQGGTDLAFALRQPKIIIILNFQPPKIMTQKSLGSKIRDSNSHLMIFFKL